MCRAGGRRCPSSSDPALAADRNKRRRDLYASKKSIFGVTQFPSLNENHPFVDINGDSPEALAYKQATREYVQAIRDHYHGNPVKIEEIESAVGYYTVDGYEEIRDYLNNYQVASSGKEKRVVYLPEELEFLSQQIEILDGVLKLSPKPSESRLLYRGLVVPRNVSEADVDNWAEDKFPVGGVISQKNYMSTTANASTALYEFASDSFDRSVIFEILSKEGAPLGDGLSYQGDSEMEVLMPRETKFKVVSVDKNVAYESEQKARSYGLGGPPVYEKETRIVTVIRLIDAGDAN